MRAEERARQLLLEMKELRSRLKEAEETLCAIRSGEVDAVVVSGPQGDQVFTLKGADHTYRTLIEEMKEGAITLMADGTILYGNRRFAEMLKTPLEKVIGSSIHRFVASEAKLMGRALLQKAIKGHSEGELTLSVGDGTLIPVYVTLNPLRLDDVSVLCMVATDLTHQRRTDEIVASERLARSILDQAGEIIVVCDENGQIIRANKMACQLCGQNPMLQPFGTIFPLRDHSKKDYLCGRKEGDGEPFSLSRVLRKEFIKGMEACFTCKDGRRLSLLLSARPLLDKQNEILGCVLTMADITEHRQAEEALERRNLELSSLNAIATATSRSLELEQVLGDTLKTVLDLMGLKAGWIFLKEEQSDRLTLVGHLGLTPEFLQEEAGGPLSDCLAFHVMERKETLVAENALECPRLSRSLPKGQALTCHASVPLIYRDKVVGVMNLASERSRPFSPEDLKLLTGIGHQVGVAIENARLFEDTRQKSAELQEAYERLKSLYEDLKAEREKTKSLRKALEDKFGLGNIVGKNDKMKAIYDLIEGVSQSDSTVLIQGESGTGKELIARAIQLLSPRKERPFVVANCSAYAQTLLESELFGHEKGAFTGAIKRKRGRFELADKGTIFLDEIGEIPLATQLLLLRVLQEKRFERVGGEDTLQVDVRVIAATNRNLNQEMMSGRFREDLYYRLNVIPIIVPPLRERKDDIALLAKHFLEIYSAANSKAIRGFSEEVMQVFLDYNWPGNVRELQNVVEHAVILAKGEMIEDIDLPQDLKGTFPR
ncbi:MAG: sigma 54-interacting transcriptional regulator, partial [Deltaproteobacteria bacterium]